MATSAKLPSVGYQEIDNSGVTSVQLNGKHGIITPTLRGPSDQPYEVDNLTDFITKFGGADTVSAPFFPQLKRAFQRGCAIYIQRLVAPGALAATLPVSDTGWLKTASNVTISANSVGAWANNNVGIIFVAGDTNGGKWGIKLIYYPDTSQNEIWVTSAGGSLTDLFTLVNANSNLVSIAVVGTPVLTSTTTTQVLSGGDNGTWPAATTTDPKSVAVNTLFENFHDILDMDTLSALGVYTAAHVQNLITYVESRKDVFGLCEVDPTLTPDAAYTFMSEDLAGVSSTYIAIYYGTSLTAYNSELNLDVAEPILADIVGVFSYNDTSASRFKAPAGSTRGLIPRVKTFSTNLLSPARTTIADKLVGAGCNIVGNHPSFGPVVWGASTFNKGVSAAGAAGTKSALDAIHVRRMLMDLKANLVPIYQSSLFDPMLPKTWRAAYNKVKPILSLLEKYDAIYSGWAYYGDQDASQITDATYNNEDDLAVGLYKVLIKLVPVGFINQIDFTVEVNNLLSMFNTTTSSSSSSSSLPSAT